MSDLAGAVRGARDDLADLPWTVDLTRLWIVDETHLYPQVPPVPPCSYCGADG